MSGWDIRALYLDYDHDTDTLRLGIDFFGIAGDADGDGDPGGTSGALSGRGGVDYPNLSQSESIAVALDVDADGTADLVVGVPSGEATGGQPLGCTDYAIADCLMLAEASPDAEVSVAFARRRAEAVTLFAAPSAARPDVELRMADFSGAVADVAPGAEDVLRAPCGAWTVGLRAVAGSFQDDGVGSDQIPNTAGHVQIVLEDADACQAASLEECPDALATCEAASCVTAAVTGLDATECRLTLGESTVANATDAQLGGIQIRYLLDSLLLRARYELDIARAAVSPGDQLRAGKRVARACSDVSRLLSREAVRGTIDQQLGLRLAELATGAGLHARALP